MHRVVIIKGLKYYFKICCVLHHEYAFFKMGVEKKEPDVHFVFFFSFFSLMVKVSLTASKYENSLEKM